jgi:hypothetical protein
VTVCCALLAGTGTAAAARPKQEAWIRSVVCPVTTSCIGLDDVGNAIQFNPLAPMLAHPRVVIGEDPLGLPGNLACPSGTQCTAVSSYGFAATFNPRAAAGTVRRTIIVRFSGRTDDLRSPVVACPSVRQCTELFGRSAVTFNPRAPTHRQTAPLPISSPTTPSTG